MDSESIVPTYGVAEPGDDGYGGGSIDAAYLDLSPACQALPLAAS